jgi:nitroreductase
MGADEMLTTTRAIRRRLDLSRPVDGALLRECLTLALQAPTGGNDQAGTSSSSPTKEARGRRRGVPPAPSVRAAGQAAEEAPGAGR